jgi:heptosyltransferase II
MGQPLFVNTMKDPKFLIIRLGALGDVINTIPLIHALRSEYPTCIIDWLTDTAYQDLVKHFTGVHNVIRADTSQLWSGNVFVKVKIVWNIWLAVKKMDTKYNGIFIPQSSFLYSILAYGIMHEAHVSFLDTAKYLPPYTPHRSRSFEIVKLLQVWKKKIGLTPIDDSGIVVSAVTATSMRADTQSTDHSFYRNTIVLFPGGGHNAGSVSTQRCWPLDSYKILTQKLLENGYSVAICGSKQDAWIQTEYCGLKNYTHTNQLLFWLGDQSLTNNIFRLQKCACIVTHDSGPLHMAKLTNIPCIALLGPVNATTLDIEHKQQFTILQRHTTLPCQPCYNGKQFAPCNNNICMKDITVEQVYQTIVKTIK